MLSKIVLSFYETACGYITGNARLRVLKNAK